MLDKRPERIALALLFGVLFYLSFSKLNLWFAIFPALAVLSLLRSPVLWSLAGFLAIFSSLLWVRIAMIDYGGVFPPVAYLLILLLSGFLVLVQFTGVFFLWRLLRYEVIALPFLWVGAEILRSHVPYGGFPWLLVGELSVDMPLIKTYLSAGGVYLGSLVVWFLALLPFIVRHRKGLIAMAMVFLLPLPFVRYKETEPPPVRVALVQTNVPEEVKLNDERFYKELPALWKLLEEVEKHDPDIVFLPESAFPFYLPEINFKGERLLEFSRKFTVVTGLIDFKYDGAWRPYNSVFVLENGNVVDFYDKVRLLPFGEYLPFPFTFMKNLFGAVAGEDYVPGEEIRCMVAKGVSIATPVCFEVSYYWIVRRFGGCSDLIAVLTNDGWFRDSDGTFQHFRQARVRAVEMGKYLLWVNNTGPSAVIDPSGEVVKEIPYGVRGFIIHSFQE